MHNLHIINEHSRKHSPALAEKLVTVENTFNNKSNKEPRKASICLTKAL